MNSVTSTTHVPTGLATSLKTEAEQQRLIAIDTDAGNPDLAARRHERTLRGLADVDAGRLIDDEAVREWADSLGTDHELPVPLPR